MVLLQLAIPRLRQMESLRDFTKLLKREDCDIYAAVKAARLPAKQTALLEAEQGAGWDLLAGLLRPRSVQVRLLMPNFLLYLHLAASCKTFPSLKGLGMNFLKFFILRRLLSSHAAFWVRIS